MEITVNRTRLLKKNKTYQIKLNNDLDTILIKGANGESKMMTVLSKLKAGEHYTIVFNACSSFEIVPSAKKKSENLIRFISLNRDSTQLFLNSAFCFVDPKQIRNKDTTEYFRNFSSGYCRYALSHFLLCPRDLDNIEKDGDVTDCIETVLYFSRNEMYSLHYDYKTKKMKIVFDGYYKHQPSIKITEITAG